MMVPFEILCVCIFLLPAQIDSMVIEATAGGDPIYTTWDGHQYPFQGTCRYLFAKPRNAPAVRQWEVQVENRKEQGSERSYTHKVFVMAHNHVIVCKEGGIVVVDGYEKQYTLENHGSLKLHNNKLIVRRSEKHFCVVEALDLHFSVEFAAVMGGRHVMTMRLKGTKEELYEYFDNMSGLAGNYNNNKDEADEFRNEDKGMRAIDGTEFGNSHLTDLSDCSF